MTRKRRQKKCFSDRIFYLLVWILCGLAFVVTLYPFLYVASMSFSAGSAIQANKVWLYPVGFDLAGYKKVLTNPQIFIDFGNSVWYTVVGTAFNLAATCLAAFPLSRERFVFRKFLNRFIAFTMYFNAGMIPCYILNCSLGFYNSRWVMVIPSLLITGYVMMCRSAFSGVPGELIESAEIDGASDWQILLKIAVPLIKPTLAVLGLYYAVFHWNDFFTQIIYITDKSKESLQVLLRRVVIMASAEMMERAGGLVSQVSALQSAEAYTVKLQVRYVTIMVATVPILVVYPFIQKYFVRGVMVGAVKG